MKDKEYTSIICTKFCSFYKQGKEDLLCGTYLFLRNNLTPRELRAAIKLSGGRKHSTTGAHPADEEIKRLVCKKCEFLVDGCDFRGSGSHPPCGGYYIIEMLLS